jgi:DNA-binding transcriptional regulator LsrR (DeoR family)
MKNIRLLDDALLVEVCTRFLNAEKLPLIAEWLANEVKARVTREDVYPLLREAVRREYFALLPPVHEVMSQRIADRYRGGQDKDRIHVLSVPKDAAREVLPNYAAKLMVTRIEEVAADKPRVGIGLGGGGTMLRVAQSLSAQLRVVEELPELGLHVLTAGFAVKRPRTAPVTFLSMFDQVPTSMDYVGLFAPAAVNSSEYDTVTRLPGVEESFKSSRLVDIVVTSLASAHDPDGELNEFLVSAGRPTKSTLAELRKKGWVGDLLYHPYSRVGPIQGVNSHVRAVSVFDLEDLRKLAEKENKHVIVVAGPCSLCGKTKESALRPLLQSESMKVWTDVVLDLTTAKELLA